jgi:hypothetical protein
MRGFRGRRLCLPGGHQAGALGTEPLSGAKRSRRGDKGSVPMAGSAEKGRSEAGGVRSTALMRGFRGQLDSWIVG